MDWIKLLEAVAWPFAVIVVALVILLITRMILNKSGKIGFKWKEIFSFEADASNIISNANVESASPDPPPALVAVAVNEPGKSDTAESLNALEPVAETSGSTSATAFSEFLEAKSVADLEAAFDKMKGEELDLEPDFWTTFFVERKQALGASDTFEEFERLAEANPTWVGPTNHLLRAAVQANDVDQALRLISQVLARRDTGNSREVLSSVVHAYYTLFSAERALRFFKEQCGLGVSSTDRATILASLASSMSTDRFASKVASEMAQLVDPGRKAEGFHLAYSYSEEAKTWAIGYNAYSEITLKGDQHTFSLNNRGVLLQDIEKRLAIDFYERGLAVGNALSASNLARRLIDDGYVGVGERLLDGIEHQQDAGEHVATTRAAALAARREMQKRLNEIRAFTAEEARRYRAVLARALKVLEKQQAVRNGVYAAPDSSLLILLDGAGAACRLAIGTLNFEGVLPPSPIGYDGMLRSPSGGILGSLASISVFATGTETLTAIIWPRSKSETDRLRVLELSQVTTGPLSEIVLPTGSLLPAS